VIAALHRLCLTGPEIAEDLEMATSTVSAVLKRPASASSVAATHPSRFAATRSSARVS
jgi:hypothetical protein